MGRRGPRALPRTPRRTHRGIYPRDPYQRKSRAAPGSQRLRAVGDGPNFGRGVIASEAEGHRPVSRGTCAARCRNRSLRTLARSGCSEGRSRTGCGRCRPNRCGGASSARSDQGAQYTALSFAERLKEVGISPSMGRIGSALDNAMVESFVSTLKAELVNNLKFPSRQAAKSAIFEYLETFYNTRRLHSSLGYRSPLDFEEDTTEGARVA